MGRRNIAIAAAVVAGLALVFALLGGGEDRPEASEAAAARSARNAPPARVSSGPSWLDEGIDTARQPKPVEVAPRDRRAPAPVVSVQEKAWAQIRRAAIESGDYDHVDWDYVDEVLSGRVQGKPDEARAGLSIAEMSKLGRVPYVQKLRKERNLQELADLGLIKLPKQRRKGGGKRKGRDVPEDAPLLQQPIATSGPLAGLRNDPSPEKR